MQMMPAANASVGPVPQMSYGMYANYQPQVGLLCTVLLCLVPYIWSLHLLLRPKSWTLVEDQTLI